MWGWQTSIPFNSPLLCQIKRNYSSGCCRPSEGSLVVPMFPTTGLNHTWSQITKLVIGSVVPSSRLFMCRRISKAYSACLEMVSANRVTADVRKYLNCHLTLASEKRRGRVVERERGTPRQQLQSFFFNPTHSRIFPNTALFYLSRGFKSVR